MRALAALVPGVVVVVLAPLGASAGPPPGATAQCRDGSYSFSRHRSGTCSRHGGVATWLAGGAGPSTSAPATPKTDAVAVGRTVLVAPRTRTGRCTLGPLPDPRCSPGAYYSGLTAAVLCSPGFHTDAIRDVPQSVKYRVEREYGLAARHYGRSLEVDHIVSLELGGSNDIANLYPEEATLPRGAPGYHVKDRLENRLHTMVCAGEIGLRSAQRQIARNWEKLYAKVFGVPLRALDASGD